MTYREKKSHDPSAGKHRYKSYTVRRGEALENITGTLGDVWRAGRVTRRKITGGPMPRRVYIIYNGRDDYHSPVGQVGPSL